MARPWFARLQGNSRGCLAFEPLFLIPYSMFTVYATIYMYELGLSEVAIGWITTISLIVQVFSSFLSGYLTDRMGRKKALLYFDILSWSFGTLLWAISQNFWFFLAAALVNGFQRVPHTAFYCLLVEDTNPKDRTYVFTILQFISVVGGLFAPLGGLIVLHYSLVPGMRIMYVLACILMTLQFIGRHLTTHETEMGLRKISETSQIGWKENLADYGSAIRGVLANPALMLIFGVYILFNFQMTLKGTYLSLYLADHLHLDSGLISLVPAVSSVFMLLTMWLIMPRIPERFASRAMFWGFAVSLVSNVLLAAAPADGLVWIGLSTVLAAVGTMICSPILEAEVANAIDDEQRAKVFSILSVLILLIISPTGIIGGWSYRLDPRAPMVLVAVAFAAAMWLMLVQARKVRKFAAEGQSIDS
ncbi:MFS transporter [Paenibacillus tarimensis]|uniref:MFS transporter n=1 Tax=Paenibacillus tarimensis TaxID=416012 RepID=UPI001F18CD8E|nr:MFS transporter [Paenibacillus tarimensis]MCF2944291.1 MFS transporter [Paenibacillus tarimensis]